MVVKSIAMYTIITKAVAMYTVLSIFNLFWDQYFFVLLLCWNMIFICNLLYFCYTNIIFVE